MSAVEMTERIAEASPLLKARIVGALMTFGGLGWLTFLAPPLASYLLPYTLVPGTLGELSLALWLLVMGVNVQRWKEQAKIG